MIRPLFFLFLLTGCFCYKGPVSEDGYFRKDIKPKNFVVDERIYNKIDTTVVYEEIGSIINNKYHTGTDYLQSNSYLKFYSNGKVSSFVGIGNNNDSISQNQVYQFTRNDFNPAKSRMGYFYIKEDKIISEFLLRHPDCYSYLLKSEITIRNDTLILSHLNPAIKNQKDIYIKKYISNELIEGWKPDW